MWLPYMSHFKSNHVFGVCNLYLFKLACSATETWNLGTDNYEHLIYYLDNENKSWPDRTGYYSGKWKSWHIYGTALTHQRLNPGTKAPLCPRYPWPLRVGDTNDYCIKRAKTIVLAKTKWVNKQKNHSFLWSPKVGRPDLKSSSHFSTYYFY